MPAAGSLRSLNWREHPSSANRQEQSERRETRQKKESKAREQEREKRRAQRDAGEVVKRKGEEKKGEARRGEAFYGVVSEGREAIMKRCC